MATIETIGTGQDYSGATAIQDWSDAVKAVGGGTLDDDYIGELAVDEVYTRTASADLDFSGVNLNGFTITLRAASGVKHNGDFGNGARVEGAASSGHLYSAQNLTIQDFSIKNTETTNNGARCLDNLTGASLKRVIAWTVSSGANCDVIRATTAAALDWEACRARGGTQGFATSGAITGTVHNCSSHGQSTSGIGLGGIGSADVINCAAWDTPLDFSYTTSGTNSNNASEDGSASGTSEVTLVIATDIAADGFTPVAGQALDGAGTNLSIALDCANNSFESTPAIGAYEAIAAGGTPISIEVPPGGTPY